jgi:hypothetical protein
VEHLEVALKTFEPQLVRDQEYRMAQLEIERELTLRKIEAEDARVQRTHALYLAGLAAGFIISVGMLVGAVIVGSDQPWLAAMLSGPSVVSLAGLFVLRRIDTVQSRMAARHQRQALNFMPPDPGAGGVV